MPSVRVTPVVGLPQFDGWSQVIESTSGTFGSLVFSLAIEGSHAGNVGRDLTTHITQASIYSFEEFYQLIEEVITISNENDVRVLLAAGCFTKSTCAYATYNGAVLLKRNRKVGRVLYSANQPKMITGLFGDQDVVVLSSLSSAHFFNEIEQKMTLGFDVDTIVTSIVPGVHSESNSSLSALAFVIYHDGFEVVLHGESPEDEFVFAGDDRVENMNDVAVATSVSQELVDSLDATIDPSGENQKRHKSQKSGEIFKQIISILKLLYKYLLKSVTWLFKTVQKIVVRTRGMLKRKQPHVKSVAFLTKILSRDTYIETSVEKKRKVLIGLAVVIAVLIIGLLGWVIRSRAQTKADAQLQSLLQPIDQIVATAQTQLASDPVIARDTLKRALALYTQVAAEYKKDSREAKVLAVTIAQTQAAYENISGLEELAQLTTFYDLRLVNSSFISKQAVFTGDTFYFLDSEAKTFIQLEKNTKKVAEFDLPTLPTVVDMAPFDAKMFFLGGGISAWKSESKVDTLLEVGDSNRAAVLMGTYQNFVYVVNPEKRNVYRYSVKDDKFSEPVGWMQVTKGLQYDTIHSIAIDGDVWIGTKNGEVRKFSKGSEQDFAIRGLTNAFSSSLILATTLESKNLYILEPDSNRIVIVSKDGDFLKQITNVALGTATDVLVDERQSALYVVSGSIIFEIPL